jgi:diguanylate cyclase (GGDEF)-like protein
MEKLFRLVQRATVSGRNVRAVGTHGIWAAYPLPSSPATPGALVLHLPRRDRKNEGELNRLLRIYRNLLLLHERSEWDALTGLHNRRSFGDEVGRLMYPARARSGRRTEEKDHWLSILDIDHFKRVNDEHGHLIGDEVLLSFAQLMRQSFRFDDRLFRYGGEEFIIILEGNNDEKTFQALDRFRRQVEEHKFPRAVRITVSIGYTHIDRDASPSEIIDRADRALYYAKTHGRNCVYGYETLVARGEMPATEYATYQDVQLWRGGDPVPTPEEESQ